LSNVKFELFLSVKNHCLYEIVPCFFLIRYELRILPKNKSMTKIHGNRAAWHLKALKNQK